MDDEHTDTMGAVQPPMHADNRCTEEAKLRWDVVTRGLIRTVATCAPEIGSERGACL
jgi:hypothetical protein